jgi:transposase
MSIYTTVSEALVEVDVISAPAIIAGLRQRIVQLETELGHLQKTYTNALEQLALIYHRIRIAKSERVEDVAEQRTLDELLIALTSEPKPKPDEPKPDERKPDGRRKRKDPPVGRRKLDALDLPRLRIELKDPRYEGVFERLDEQISHRVDYVRGGFRHVELVRIVYNVTPHEPAVEAETTAPAGLEAPLLEVVVEALKTVATTPTSVCQTGTSLPPKSKCEAKFETATAPLPKELYARGMLGPGLIAMLLVSKYMMGAPFYRLEQRFASEGFPLDRGTMCRYAEHIGASLGVIVEAARAEALRSAFCLSTDATGVLLQPTPLSDGSRQPCRKGHFFVTLADRDHIFFDFVPKHTSDAVRELFKGYEGFIQADAHIVYDSLFRGDASEGSPPTEVGCWAHARRKFWEAAVCKHAIGLEGLVRINAIFEVDRKLRELAPSQRKLEREKLLRPLINNFFAWAQRERDKHTGRGLVPTALGYVCRQESPLCAFFADGRLKLDNNASERALRPISIGRKNWLFFGSDDHAQAAANLFSLIASCKLHNLDVERYLAEVIRILPYWPSTRCLELTPKYWLDTRKRLSPEELAVPLGHITVPPPLTAEEKEMTG